MSPLQRTTFHVAKQERYQHIYIYIYIYIYICFSCKECMYTYLASTNLGILFFFKKNWSLYRGNIFRLILFSHQNLVYSLLNIYVVKDISSSQFTLTDKSLLEFILDSLMAGFIFVLIWNHSKNNVEDKGENYTGFEIVFSFLVVYINIKIVFILT